MISWCGRQALGAVLPSNARVVLARKAQDSGGPRDDIDVDFFFSESGAWLDIFD